MESDFDVTELNKVGMLGSGGYGNVWKVQHGAIFVAVKICEHSDEEDVAKEAKILSRLKHPNIVAYLGLSKDQDAIMLEYVGYEIENNKCLHSLRDFLAYVGKMEDIGDHKATIPFIASEVLKGLAYLHSQGLAHRDLKPANVLVGKMDAVVVKLTDFGESWANLLENTVRTHTMNPFKGTNIFMAPEIVARREKRGRINQHEMQIADVWGFGMICSCLLNLNILPFSEELKKANVKKKDTGKFIETLIVEKKVPVDSEKYVNNGDDWEILRRAKDLCLVYNPNERVSVEELGGIFGKDLDLYQSIRLKIHQGTALEKAQTDNVVHGKSFDFPSNDGSGSCAFLSTKIALDWNGINVEMRSNMKTIAPLVEDIITKYPEQVNKRRDRNKYYTIEEVLPIINDIEGTESELVEMVDGSDINNEEASSALLRCLKDIDGAGILTCEPYSFVIGNSFGQAFTIDTHSIPYHIGGDGNAVIMTFPTHSACIKWIRRRVESANNTSFHVAQLEIKLMVKNTPEESSSEESSPSSSSSSSRQNERNLIDEEPLLRSQETESNERNESENEDVDEKVRPEKDEIIIIPDDDVCGPTKQHSTGVRFFKDNPSLPIYRSGQKCAVESKDAAKVILKGISKEKTCTTVPKYVDMCCEFVVDKNHLAHWRDIQTNLVDLVKTRTKNQTMSWKGKSYTVTRYTYYHKSEFSFKRVIVTVSEKTPDDPLPLLYVQYYFTGQEKSITFSASKKRKTNYSVRQSIKDVLNRGDKLSPKQVFATVCKKNGGFESANAADLPSSLQQVYDIKGRQKEKSDEMVELIDMCNMQNQTENPFLRTVLSAPDFGVVVASNRQLNDIKRFSVDSNTSVVGVDPTYNLCGHYVTLATTRNPTLVVPGTGVHPVLLGPALLHSQKTEQSYCNLPNVMCNSLPELGDVRVFGTDGEVAVYSALRNRWRSATHLLCWIHSKDNVKMKLNGLQMDEKKKAEYLKDIYGEKVGSTKVKGLGDSESEEEFEKKFSELERKWRNDGQVGKVFLTYFVKYKKDLIKRCMITPVRQKAGLGSPPAEYNQNGNECYNSVLKRSMGKKKMSMKETIDLLKKEVDDNDLHIQLALAGRGKWRVSPVYRDQWELTPDRYDAMNASQRERYVQDFLNLKIPMIEPVRTIVRDVADTVAEEDLVPPISVVQIPSSICEEIREGANTLLKNPTYIVEGPAGSEKVYLHNSANKKTPFTVCKPQPKGKGKDVYTCDKTCTRFKMHELCEHTCAVAKRDGQLDAFIKKLSSRNCKTPVSRAANASKDKGAGRKATKATMVRKGPPNQIPTKIMRLEEPIIDIDEENDPLVASQPSIHQQTTMQSSYQPASTFSSFGSSFSLSSSPQTNTSWIQPAFNIKHLPDPIPPKHNPAAGQYIISPLKMCDSRVRQCSTCHKHFDSDNPLVVVSKGLKDRFDHVNRQYIPGNEPKNMYFHWDIQHIRSYDPSFTIEKLVLPAYVKPHLTQQHQSLIITAGLGELLM